MNAEWPAYWGLNRRTVAEIQGKIVDQGEQHAVSRALYAKSNKDTIAAWRQDLHRILHIFNVRSADSTRCSLTSSFKTELAINTHMLVADMHRNALPSQEGTFGRHQSVSAIFYLSTTKL